MTSGNTFLRKFVTAVKVFFFKNIRQQNGGAVDIDKKNSIDVVDNIWSEGLL